MTPKQRNSHRLIWVVFALVLPLLFLWAIQVIPQSVHQEKLYQEVDNESPSPNQPQKQ